MKETTLQHADRIGSMKPYTPPPRDPEITLKLDNNEGAPIDASILDSIKSIDPEDLTRYPDTSDLERSITDHFGIPASRVIITNGGDDAIDRTCRALLGSGDSLLTHTPGFVMIPRYAQLAGAVINLIDWLGTDFPLSKMLESIDDQTRLVALVSPCNPTGSVIDLESIVEIASKAQSVGAVVLLDQAYIEFADEDPIEQLLRLPNLIIVRTFSKAMGLAGIRVGYAIGPEAIIGWLRTVGGPYPVSVLSLKIAQSAFSYGDQRSKIVELTKVFRKQLTDTLESSGSRVLPSQGNFVLAQFKDASETYKALLRHGVSVRRFRQGGEIDSYLRITVPTDQSQLNQLLDSLNTIGSDL